MSLSRALQCRLCSQAPPLLRTKRRYALARYCPCVSAFVNHSSVAMSNSVALPEDKRRFRRALDTVKRLASSPSLRPTQQQTPDESVPLRAMPRKELPAPWDSADPPPVPPKPAYWHDPPSATDDKDKSSAHKSPSGKKSQSGKKVRPPVLL